MFENYWGNRHVALALERMIAGGRIAQTLLFSGPEGVGKATLARRFAARLLHRPELIERDDLSLPEHVSAIASREKLVAEKRNEDPLMFASHPDFVTFPPDGPLRQLSIPQMRMLKERASFQPLHGNRRVFLIDHIDRAGEQAANSLLKILEEPPAHLILILTAENAYDLLPTIRSRAVMFQFAPLSNEDMRAFATARGLSDVDRRMALSAGSPGIALSLDLALHEKRRSAMHVLLKVAAGASPFGAWLPFSESIARSKSEKLELYLRLLYDLLRDLMILRETGGEIRNQDLRPELTALAGRVTTPWIARGVKKVDELADLLRRNIQKTIALDGLILDLQGYR
ncbi:MAG: AAA family ATPase [Acidobacteriota bacterium]|nr:AAA family ATPase [Acidobacteriota bacterium]